MEKVDGGIINDLTERRKFKLSAGEKQANLSQGSPRKSQEFKITEGEKHYSY